MKETPRVHKPGCGANIVCAVYHADGICNHPKHGKCDCGIEGVPVTKTPREREWEVTLDEAYGSFKFAPRIDKKGFDSLVLFIRQVEDRAVERERERIFSAFPKKICSSCGLTFIPINGRQNLCGSINYKSGCSWKNRIEKHRLVSKNYQRRTRASLFLTPPHEEGDTSTLPVRER